MPDGSPWNPYQGGEGEGHLFDDHHKDRVVIDCGPGRDTVTITGSDAAGIIADATGGTALMVAMLAAVSMALI